MTVKIIALYMILTEFVQWNPELSVKAVSQ